MKCSKCSSQMKEVNIKVQDAKSLVTSHQCGKCGYFDFEGKSMEKAIDEIMAKEALICVKPIYA